MNPEDIFLILAWMTCFILLRRRIRSNRWRNRRWWVRPINQLWLQEGDYYNLYQQLKFDDTMLHRYIRMDLETFYELLRMVYPYLLKTSPRALPPEHRLLTALRYHAIGDVILSVSVAFRIGESTSRNVIKEVAQVLVQVLAPTNLQTPDAHRWAEICLEYLRYWNFPNYPGAFDGKHFEIKAPPQSGSMFFNYKKRFSIVLLDACDVTYKFTLGHMGEMGNNNDASIFSDSSIGQALRRGELDLPPGTAALPGSLLRTRTLFLGDSGFPILTNLMVPYGRDFLEESKRIFNYRLSRTRRTIENAFRILTTRWRMFRRASALEVDSVDAIILATICLHIFLRNKDIRENPPAVPYCPPRFVDWDQNGILNPSQWRGDMVVQGLQNLPPAPVVNVPQSAIDTRNTLRNYFLTPEGEVPWQYEYVRSVGND